MFTFQVEEGTFRVEFPDIFQTLILNREIMPGGRGKRLRVRGEFFGMLANVQANQVSFFANRCATPDNLMDFDWSSQIY